MVILSSSVFALPIILLLAILPRNERPAFIPYAQRMRVRSTGTEYIVLGYLKKQSFPLETTWASLTDTIEELKFVAGSGRLDLIHWKRREVIRKQILGSSFSDSRGSKLFIEKIALVSILSISEGHLIKDPHISISISVGYVSDFKGSRPWYWSKAVRIMGLVW